MANNTLAIRFTEDEYATKSQVAKELRTNMVESFWTLIRNYRKSFEHEVPLRTINNEVLTICLCPSTIEIINSCEVKNLTTITHFNEIAFNNNDIYQFELKASVEILKSLGEFYDFIVDETYLRMVLTDGVRELDPNHLHLGHYRNALRTLKTCDKTALNIDIIAELYSALTNNYELTSLYRMANLNQPRNKVLINRLYGSAPSRMLDGMMDTFIEYINEGSGSVLTKAATAMLYINYIKPFEVYNEEMSILIAKWVLLSNGYGDSCVFINLEKMLYEHYENVNKFADEAQRSGDTTYFVRYFIEVYSREVDKIASIISNVQAQDIKDDYYAEAVKEADEIKRELENGTLEEPEEVIPEEEIEEPSIRAGATPIPMEEADKIIIGEKEEPQPKTIDFNDYNHLAVDFVPQELNEDEAHQLEIELLENDPELRRGQAYFFARHCIMGRRYTISQYKRALNCAYETARSSMENLTRLGYYRQEMVKNKKVYTPIRRK